jgi:GR25 family glycosyltransferase involved in LPS biosynthesis
MNRAGCKNFTFFSAIDGNLLKSQNLLHTLGYDDNIRKKYENKSLSPSIIALAATHFKLYEHIKQKGIAEAIILEDDAILTRYPLENTALSDTPKKWDVLLLESWLIQKPPDGQIIKNIYDTTSYRGGSAAYIITTSGIDKLLSIRKPLIHPPDGLFTWYNKHAVDNFKCYPLQDMAPLHVYLYYPQPFINGSLAGYWGSRCDPYNIVY